MESCSEQRKQTGSFLLIVMVVMLVMTFSGLMVMETALLEEVTVGNEQRTSEVYQVAFNELESQFSYLDAHPVHFRNAFSGKQETLSPIVNPNGCNNAGGICQRVTLRYISNTLPPPGFDIAKFIGRVYELDSVAILNGSGASSSQTLGIIFVDTLPGS
ncbi:MULTISPECIES: hypothetical protein [Gammaproteobacteria]|uniref:pilus assembly PilX family protein n=1 Tax=Gammaproteobacteria TaxID=1236 RepID=UPI001ADA1B38|nr:MULTISPECIES: hypothetical protein [Gammaproteobacteria]MBO9481364.1 hypothetical protein [Salinisphaera sp. G21_0]MBO9493779.1 hypothetical protein [Thalassotalea sp. G20_0]